VDFIEGIMSKKDVEAHSFKEYEGTDIFGNGVLVYKCENCGADEGDLGACAPKYRFAAPYIKKALKALANG
jgi:hypothetical protein